LVFGQREQVEEVADLVTELRGMAHFDAAVDRVVVPTAVALAFDESRLDQVGKEALSRAFGDPDMVCDVAQSYGRIAGDAEEHLGVVGDEPPGALGLFLT
jgi:hypothetical protein